MGVVTDPNLIKELDGLAGQSAPAYPGVIRGQVSPSTVREEARKERDDSRDEARFNLDYTKFQRDLAKDEQDATEKARKFENARTSAVTSLSGVMDAIDRISLDTAANNGWWQTGKSGAFVRDMPGFIAAGTDAYDLASSLKTIDANTAFSALNEMRQNSPTGGALGAITEKELDLLKATIASLDPNQSQERFFLNLAIAKKTYLDKLRMVDPALADEYAKKPGIRFDEKGNPTLVSVAGEDKREAIDPFGVNAGKPPEGGGGPDGGPGGGGGTSYSPGSLLTGLAQGAGDIVEGAGDFVGLVGNPLNATINAATGANLSTDLGASLREGLGLPKNPNKLASVINQGATMALMGGGLARMGGGALAGLVTPSASASLVARGVGRPVSTLAQAMPGALQAFGRTPIRDAAAGAAAGAGALVGEQMGGAKGAVIGALSGGLAGYGAAGKIGARVVGERVPNAVMKAADELDMTMLPADVGGVGTRMATGAVGMSLGGIPLAEGASRAVGSAQAARGRIAGAIGEVADETGAGQAVRRGFNEWKGTSLSKAQALDEAIEIAPESPVQLANTRNALGEITRGMKSNPKLSKLWVNYPRLRETLDALSPKEGAAQTADGMPDGGSLSWEDMRRFRSIVGEIIGQPGIKRDGPEIAAMRKLYKALSTDMEVTAVEAGPKALDQFNKAQRYWRGREGRIENVFETLLGKNDNRSDEAVYRQLNTWAKAGSSDFQRLASTIRSMPKDEADTIRATIVSRMGNAKPAKGGEDVFTPTEFTTQWNGLNGRAKSVLFPDAKHREALDKFAKVTNAMSRAQEFQNFSRTSLGTNLTGVGLTALSGPAGWTAAAAYAGGTFSLGKLLASPRFARMIATETRLRPEQAGRKFSEQLSVLATREPLLATDAKGLQDFIARSINASPSRAAAQDEPNGRGEPPQ